MPQASDELRARWSMETAWDTLKAGGYVCDEGLWWHPDRKPLTEEEGSAMDYLFAEWDFGFDPDRGGQP